MRLALGKPLSPPPASLRSGDMADLFFDAAERAQLSDLFDELGPEAPTLLWRNVSRAPWFLATFGNEASCRSPKLEPWSVRDK